MTRNGAQIAQPVVDQVIATIRANEIGLLIVEPFVAFHRVTENDNPAIELVAATWAAIANVTGCAVELVHHSRKTGGAEITVEDGRGGSALLAKARSARVLNGMSEDEAARSGVEKRRSFFRVDKRLARSAAGRWRQSGHCLRGLFAPRVCGPLASRPEFRATVSLLHLTPGVSFERDFVAVGLRAHPAPTRKSHTRESRRNCPPAL